MYAASRLVKKGFTLVEILIVVIILGILAAIVIPQFTSASEDARKNSLTSQVQTLRSQIELYKLQHETDGSELFPAGAADGAASWEQMTNITSKATGVVGVPVAPDKPCGPYLQTVPVNGMHGDRSLVANDNTATETSTGHDTNAGFVYNPDTGKFFALDKDGNVYTGAE